MKNKALDNFYRQRQYEIKQAFIKEATAIINEEFKKTRPKEVFRDGKESPEFTTWKKDKQQALDDQINVILHSEYYDKSTENQN